MKLKAIPRSKVAGRVGLAVLLAAGAWSVLSVKAQDVDKRVLQSQAKRIAVINKVKPAVVAIFSPGGQGGGSGVLISPDGYALTNFHVVSGMMRLPVPAMQCGLPDGGYYDGIVVGLDKVGDVALVKLLPKKKKQKFPFAPLGNSDKVKEGDWSLAMGNPFLLATDFKPTVTFGLISGVHRYQYPEGTLLEYTDCIQIDTSINPGNSGGPLFNMDGELIGINGRGSFDKRSRINSGVGYAISINQIKNFLGLLRAGLDTDHASLGAKVQSEKEEGDLGRLIVNEVLETSDAARRGLQVDDVLVKFGFGNRSMGSVNQFKNVLGIYPKGWRVPLTYRRKIKGGSEVDTEILVRLQGYRPQAIGGQPGPMPRPVVRPMGNMKPSPAAKLFEAKRGFANYYFNKQARDRLLAGFRKHGNFSKLKGEWTITAEKMLDGAKGKTETAHFQIIPGKDKTTVRGIIGNTDDTIESDSEGVITAPGETGLLFSLHLYREMLTQGIKGFTLQCDYGGIEPFFPPPADGKKPKSLEDLRVDAEVLLTKQGRFTAKWYFSTKDQTLLGLEARSDDDSDPCEVCFADYKKVNGRLLPGRMTVRHANDVFGTFAMTKYKLGN